MNDGPPRRLTHFTPLRYPGGKGKLAAYVKSIIRDNGLVDGEYVEPYAGGAAIALELLLQEYVTRIHINDVSRPVWAFWHSVLHHTDELCRLIVETPRTVEAWDRQKAIFANDAQHSDLEVGFATFFLNRTNRSGILNAGIIGGRAQNGPWKIDARYNAEELAFRVRSIAKLKARISLTRLDAVDLLKQGADQWPRRTLVYLDPPYFVKGRDLYYDFYLPDDHRRVAELVRTGIVNQRWIVSYDNVPEIRALYSDATHITYSIGYSARTASTGTEVMFFSKGLHVPDVEGSMRLSVGGLLPA
jgi:DNA adenine methylase